MLLRRECQQQAPHRSLCENYNVLQKCMANHHQPYSHTADVCVCVVQHDEVKKQKLRVEETNSKNEEIVQIEWIRINRERDGTSSNVRHALFFYLLCCCHAFLHSCKCARARRTPAAGISRRREKRPRRWSAPLPSPPPPPPLIPQRTALLRSAVAAVASRPSQPCELKMGNKTMARGEFGRLGSDRCPFPATRQLADQLHYAFSMQQFDSLQLCAIEI